MKKLLVLLTLTCSLMASEGHHWNYEHQNEWEIVHGDHQSPINIVTDTVENYDANIWNNWEGVFIKEVEDNGHTIIAKVEGGESLINGRKFNLLQFHFHAKSEHTVNGEHYPMEVHFVHQSQDGRYAVLGVFFKEGEKNEAFEKVMNSLNKNEKIKIDMSELLPDNKIFYHYLGSLTTPPLAENVEWYIYQTPVELSKDQIKEFTKYYDHNFRNLQDLDGRKILINR